MNKIIRKIFFIFVIATTVFINNNIKVQALNYDYVIENYNVNMTVNENNTFDIEENIEVFFNKPKHGIYRTLPLRNTLTRLDGTTTKNKAQVYNVSVNEEYSVSRENGMYKIKIGSPNHTVTEIKKYTIKYTYNIGKDPLKDKDELYYNLIGTGWNDTIIKNVHFNIKMPKEFDQTKLGFSKGKLGSIDNQGIYYSIEGNTITGYYHDTLENNEGITIRLELDEGYFKNAGYIIQIDSVLYFSLIPIISLLIVILMIHRSKNKNKTTDTIEFYPPENMNSLEVGFYYKGYITNKDITSLIIYLANKGYIEIQNKTHTDNYKISEESKTKAVAKIKELEEQIKKEIKTNPNSKKLTILRNTLDVYKNIDKPIEYSNDDIDEDYKIVKLKDYDGNNNIEELFFKGLFSTKHKYYCLDETNEKILEDSISDTTNIIKGKMNSEKNISSFTKNRWLLKLKKSFILFLNIINLISLPFACIVTNLVHLDEVYLLLGYLFINMILISFPYWTFDKEFDKYDIIITIIPMFIFIEICIFGMFYAYLPLFILGSIINIINIINFYLYTKIEYQRNDKGLEILGKINGFKKYLETVEKEKIKSMIQENPNYFYDILPYAYVLGISNEVMNKFKFIIKDNPTWYHSSASFDQFMSSSISNINNSMNNLSSYDSGSSSSGSSSSSSSGGGSSGGGSGGGGGGSW